MSMRDEFQAIQKDVGRFQYYFGFFALGVMFFSTSLATSILTDLVR